MIVRVSFQITKAKTTQMKQCMYVILLGSLVGFMNCSPKNKQDEPVEKKAQIEKSGIDIPSPDSVLTAYLHLFPDTSKLFSDWKQFSDYFKPLKKTFDNTKAPNGRMLRVDDSENSLLIKREFDGAMSILVFKHIKKLPKDNVSMNMLAAHNPNSSISIAERLAVFETFPKVIKENETGKKTLKLLSEYIYGKNNGVNFSLFSDVNIIYPNSEKGKFSSVLASGNLKKYTILSFGASWCMPCLIQERQLKKAYSKIDTSLIRVVGIMIDVDHNKFKNYIEREQFPWNCYRINDGFENSILKKLDVNGIPMNFLLDDSGKVLKEDLDVFNILSYLNMKDAVAMR